MFNCGFILFTVSVPKDEIDSDLHDIKVQVKTERWIARGGELAGHRGILLWWSECDWCVLLCCYIPLTVRPSASIDTLYLAAVHHPPPLLHTRTEVTSKERGKVSEYVFYSLCPYFGSQGRGFLSYSA